ncbi:MAG: hypothetical protein AB1782_04375 [Cyanobacteriota bacterium]
MAGYIEFCPESFVCSICLDYLYKKPSHVLDHIKDQQLDTIIVELGKFVEHLWNHCNNKYPSRNVINLISVASIVYIDLLLEDMKFDHSEYKTKSRINNISKVLYFTSKELLLTKKPYNYRILKIIARNKLNKYFAKHNNKNDIILLVKTLLNLNPANDYFDYIQYTQYIISYYKKSKDSVLNKENIEYICDLLYDFCIKAGQRITSKEYESDFSYLKIEHRQFILRMIAKHCYICYSLLLIEVRITKISSFDKTPILIKIAEEIWNVIFDSFSKGYDFETIDSKLSVKTKSILFQYMKVFKLIETETLPIYYPILDQSILLGMKGKNLNDIANDLNLIENFSEPKNKIIQEYLNKELSLLHNRLNKEFEAIQDNVTFKKLSNLIGSVCNYVVVFIKSDTNSINRSTELIMAINESLYYRFKAYLMLNNNCNNAFLYFKATINKNLEMILINAVENNLLCPEEFTLIMNNLSQLKL